MVCMKRSQYLVQDQQRQELIIRLQMELEKEAAITFAYLYGSLLETDTVHDVDVGIDLHESATAQGSALALAVSARLTTAVGLPVDVRVLNEVPLSFLYHVLRGRVLVCHDDAFLAALIEDVSRRYLDLAPLVRQSTKDAFAA